MSDQPNCACLKISYTPQDVEFENPETGKPMKGKRSRWTCDLCGTEYINIGIHEYEIERLTAEVSSLRKIINDAVSTEIIGCDEGSDDLRELINDIRRDLSRIKSGTAP